MDNSKKWYRNLFVKNGMDIPFFLILLVLMTIGLVMLLSSSYFYAYYYTSDNDSLHYFKRQLVFSVMGIAVMLFVSKFDFAIFRRFAALGMLGSIGLLILVLLLPGSSGVHRWIVIGPLQFQPSELAKFFLILYCARGLDMDYRKLVSGNLSQVSYAKKVYEISGHKIKITQGTTTLFYYLCVVLFTAVLVAAGSHLSGTILMLGIGVVMLWLGEGRARWFAVGVVAVAIVGIYVVMEYDSVPFLKDYMGERIQAWLDKSFEPTGARWQTNQSLYAIGSGGFLGAGLGNSKEKYLYVSEPQNDFIFAIVCEELGFVGAALILLLYAALILRGVYIAVRAKNRFGALICMGMVFQLGLQVALNVAVVTDTVPNTGISLPFFSYGGTSLMLFLVEMGVVLGVSRQANLPRVYTFRRTKKVSAGQGDTTVGTER